MRHHKKGRKFGRETDQRRALMKALAVNLVRYEKIKTTEAKAKELRPFMEKFITRAKGAGLNDKKLLVARIGGMSAKKLVESIAPKYKDRNGGYTRIVKLPRRKGDGSKMALIEFV